LEKEKPPVFGMIQRSGEVFIRMLENVQQNTIKPLIQKVIVPGSQTYTDEYSIYTKMEKWGYPHKTVNHGSLRLCVESG